MLPRAIRLVLLVAAFPTVALAGIDLELLSTGAIGVLVGGERVQAGLQTTIGYQDDEGQTVFFDGMPVVVAEPRSWVDVGIAALVRARLAGSAERSVNGLASVHRTLSSDDSPLRDSTNTTVRVGAGMRARRSRPGSPCSPKGAWPCGPGTIRSAPIGPLAGLALRCRS